MKINMKSVWLCIGTVITAVYILIGAVFFSAEAICFNEEFYAEKHQKLGTAEQLGMSEEDLQTSMVYALDYLKGEHAELDVCATINGEYTQVFNERESAHMTDVRNLYQYARIIANACVVMAVVFVLGLLFLGGRENVPRMYKTFNITIFAVIVILAALGIYAAMDFNSFWTAFHGVFFNNDLWMLNPATDRMIVMLPGEIFSDIVFKVILYFAITVVAVLAVAGIAYKFVYKRKAKRV